MGRRRNSSPRPGLLRGRQRRCTSAIEMGRRGPCSTDIARSSVWRLLTLCHDAGRDTTVNAHTTRCVQIMPRPHPPESTLAPVVIPSITATEFATWLLAPHSIGPCPWSVGRAEPSAPRSRHCPHETDATVADILAIFESIDR